MHGASFAPRPVGAATPGDVPVSMLTLSNWAGDRDLYGSLPIVPVIVKSNGVEVHTFALLDQGSQVSLIHNSIAGQLNLKGPKRKTLTGTFHGNDPVIVTRRVNFELLSVDGISSFQVKQAESVPSLNISRRPIDWNHIKKDWPHLKHVPMPEEVTAADVKVLIGIKVSDAHDILEVRKAPISKKNAPKGVLTPFGWIITGAIDIDRPTYSQVNFINDQPLPVDGLPERFDRWCQGESFGTDPQVKRPIPADDRKGQELLEKLIKHHGDKWETGLLWRKYPPDLNDNYEVALRRFKSLQRRFDADLEYAENYSKIVEGYAARGFSRRTTKEELENAPPGTVFYLPNHGVIVPNKPVRVVFDASAKYKGVCLNDRLYRGIDYLNSLTSVLTSFRRHFYAVSMDIEKMFHMVKVRERDQSALRYLWKLPGKPGPPEIWQMTVMPFGLVCSPSVCFYLIQRTASDNEMDFPGLLLVIKRAFYADNYLDSFDDYQEAIDRCGQMRAMLKRGGFNLSQLVASDRHILAAFPDQIRSNPYIDLDFDQLQLDRALGQNWNCETDCFELRASIKVESIAATTRRQLLSVVASIFDPLGFLAPVTLTGKLILQATYRDAATWDMPLQPALLTRWKNWTQSLHDNHPPFTANHLDFTLSKAVF